jgi:hypothetical protein
VRSDPCRERLPAGSRSCIAGPGEARGGRLFRIRHRRSAGATWRSGYATVCKTVYPGSIPGVASTSINGLVRAPRRPGPALPTRLIGQHIDGEAARELLVVPRRPLSAPLFANKLRAGAGEIAGAATPGCGGICRHRRGGRNAGILAVHCLRVAIDLTRERRRIYRRRCDGHRIHGLTGLSEKLGCKRDASREHERP